MPDYSPKDRISRTPPSESGRTSRKGIIIAVVCTLIVVAAIIIFCVVLFLKLGKNSDDDANVKKRDVVLTKDNVDDILSQSETPVNADASSYVVTMTSTEWEFKDGSSTSADSYVQNSTMNSYPVYFDIVRSDTEETIYSSPIIPVGSHLEDFKLDKDLDAGTYDCIMTYYQVDDDQTVLSHVNLALKIIVKN